MLLHLAPLDDWLAHSERPYAPASLALEGFVHCSADEETVLAVANARFAAFERPLMVLLIDEDRLDAPVRWEPAAGGGPALPGGAGPAAAGPGPGPMAGGVALAPPPGQRLFPHVYGPINRSAVAGMLEVERDAATGRWASLALWS